MTTSEQDMSPSALTFEELEGELATLAAHLHAGTCRWLELVAELDRRGGWYADGRGSLAEWPAWRCDMSPRSAREHLRVARCLTGLPLTRAAFGHGELSYAKVRAVTRVATPENEEELLGFAGVYTAAELERIVRSYRRVTVDEARDLQHDAFLSTFWNPDGSLEFHGRLAPEDGALFLRAVEALRDTLRKRSRGSAEPRVAWQASAAKAVVAMADAAIARETEGRTGGERYQVVVHADRGVLENDGEGECALDDGSALAAETARRPGCDASVIRNGRRSRTIPPALRRALRIRDRGCRFPGCRSRRFVDAHHVDHWAKGGETTVRNLPRGDPKALAVRNRGLGIGPRTCEPAMPGPFDLDGAVDAMISLQRRTASRSLCAAPP